METEIISRLECMASNDPQWDLSKNDIEAIEYAVYIIKELQKSDKKIFAQLNDLYFGDEPAITAQ